MYKKLLFSILLTVAVVSAKASHYMGNDISYECINSCVYRIYNSTYLDCSGSAMGSYVPMTPGNPFPSPAGSVTVTGVGCAAPALPSAWILQSWAEVTPICPGFQTDCTSGSGSSINGVAQATYFVDYNLCNSNCTSIQISTSFCCRNYAITSGAGGNTLYTSSSTINLGLSPCNSSPTFANPPIPYICQGQTFTFNQGAYDPDGDSLSYSLGPCYQAANSQVTYNAGYSANAPLGAGWTVTMNPLTGDVTFAPTPNGPIAVGVMCIYVTEWRKDANGVYQQIGQISRDMQITVIPCSSTSPQTDGITNLVVNGSPTTPVSSTSLGACALSPICFEIPTLNAQLGLIYTMSWNQAIPGGLFFNANNPNQTNSFSNSNPVAKFCWTPPAPGNYSFVVTLEDDNCPINGINQFTIQLNIAPSLVGSSATAVNVSCTDMQFSVVTAQGNPGPFTYSWTGGGNMGSNPGASSSSFIHTFPGPGSYPWQLQVTDPGGCNVNLQGIATVQNGPTANAGSDVVICSGFPFQMGAAPISGQTYNWTPTTGLSSGTSANPTFNYLNTGTQPDTIDFTLEVVQGLCSTYDFAQAIVFPTPTVDITPNNPNICFGDTVVLTATGGATYLWSTGETSNSITVVPSATSTYSVVSFANGCSSVPAYETVTVTPVPTATISGVMSLCAGSSTTLVGNGAGSYVWSTGSLTSSTVLTGLLQDTTITMVPFVGNCPGLPVSATVEVHPNPIVNFSSTTVCENSATNFTDLTLIASGSIIGWNWNFGTPSLPNNSSVLQNPSHVYTQDGTYSVALTATSDFGCTNTINVPVTVTAAPDVNFTFANVCDGNAVNFNNTSTIPTGNSISTYSWNFGDNATSANINDSHLYGGYGYYNVTLTGVSSNGCTDQFTQTVFVSPNPVASFTSPAVCQLDAMPFTQTSVVAGNLDEITSVVWNFGDPITGSFNTSTAYNPQHNFSAPGTYNVSLNITTNNNCTSAFSSQVTVYPHPVADFTVDKTCANEKMEFTDLSIISDPNTPVTAWTWVLPNNVQLTQQNPSFDMGQLGAGVYPITLIASSSERCTNAMTHNIVVNPVPVPNFEFVKVCLGDTTPITNTSTVSIGAIANYSWVLEPGTPPVSTVNPLYVFPKDGVNYVTLTAVTDSGCTHTVTKQVLVNALPLIPTILDDTVCYGQKAVLSLSTANFVDKVRWYKEVNDPEPFHVGYSYVTSPLLYPQTFYVQLANNNCKGNFMPIQAFLYNREQVQMLVSDTVVEMPVQPITFSTNSTAPLVAWTWDFGDGNTSAVSIPSHEYLYPGIFTVNVTTEDRFGCKYSDARNVEVKRVVTLSVPTAFSPNGDLFNDEFFVGDYNTSASFLIQIYDRWGGLVYESTDKSFRWNGKSLKGIDSPEGVYVWVVKNIAFDGSELKQSGTVTILR